MLICLFLTIVFIGVTPASAEMQPCIVETSRSYWEEKIEHFDRKDEAETFLSGRNGRVEALPDGKYLAIYKVWVQTASIPDDCHSEVHVVWHGEDK